VHRHLNCPHKLTSDYQLRTPLISQRLFPFLWVSCMLRPSDPCQINYVDSITGNNETCHSFCRRHPLFFIYLLNSSQVCPNTPHSTLPFLTPSPSLKSNHSSTTQEFPCILCKTKRHYNFHKSPPFLPNLSYIILLLEYAFQNYPNIYSQISQAVSFSQVSSPNPCNAPLLSPYVLHAPLIPFVSVSSLE
jgi:hypothetical protein